MFIVHLSFPCLSEKKRKWRRKAKKEHERERIGMERFIIISFHTVVGVT